MKPIQYCPKNDKLGTRQVHADIARDFPDVKQQRKGCLKECKICRRQPFVKVGKKLICADTPEQLYEQLTLLIRKQDDKPKKAETSDLPEKSTKTKSKKHQDDSQPSAKSSDKKNAKTTKKMKKRKKQLEAVQIAHEKSQSKNKGKKVKQKKKEKQKNKEKNAIKDEKRKKIAG